MMQKPAGCMMPAKLIPLISPWASAIIWAKTVTGYYWYLKGTFSGGAEEAATKTNDVNEKTYEMTFTAVTTTHQWTIDSVLKSLKRVFCGYCNAAFDPDGWFEAGADT